MLVKKIPYLLLILLFSCSPKQAEQGIENLPLSHFRPQSVYNIPKTEIEKAAFPLIDMHSHDYAENADEIESWVATMAKMGVEKTVLLSKQSGAGFDAVKEKYSKFPDQFEIWCGIDFTGYDTDPAWTTNAIKELERCHEMGAKGVGELGDKGEGMVYSEPVKAYGLHLDNPDLQAVWAKCAELNMPVNVHIADPIWMYEPMDSTNDGLMNAYEWKIDLTKEGILNHAELIQSLENTVKNNPATTFIACHFANCSYDLAIIGDLLDKYPNLWVDNSARYAETAPIPKFAGLFYEKYQDRIIYGTDMGMDEPMYKVTFRVLETEDEHFYESDMFGYHWALNGFGLSDEVLKKVYKENALKISDSK